MNPYSVLGVPIGANEATCKSAYRRLSMTYHPDRGGDVKKFMQVKNAFEFLKKKGFPQMPHDSMINVYGRDNSAMDYGAGVLTHVSLFNFDIR